MRQCDYLKFDSIVGSLINIEAGFRFIGKLATELDIDDLDLLPAFRTAITRVADEQIEWVNRLRKELERELEEMRDAGETS